MAIERRAPAGQNVAPAEAEFAPVAVKTTDGVSRTLFRGTEDKARQWIKDHFPWMHVTPGDDWGDAGPMPEVVLTHPDNSEEFWNGEKWVTEAELPTDGPVVKAEPPAADIPAGSKAEWNGTEWVLVPDDGTEPADTGVVTEQVGV